MKKIFLTIMILVSTNALAQEFLKKFNDADDSLKANMCGPILLKEYTVISIAVVNEKNKGKNIENINKIAINIGYRGKAFDEMSKKSNSDLNKRLWEESAYKNASKDYSGMASTCVDLYNKERKLGKINQTIEKESIDWAIADMAKTIKKY